jgi:hypothetical protein
MSNLGTENENIDIVNTGYTSTALVITDAAEVIANDGINNLDNRQILTITNKGPNIVYYGPTGTTIANRDTLKKTQFLSAPIGDCIDMTFICDTGQTATIVVQEFS